MKIAIIGSGYIGSICAAQLRRYGHNVLATTTTPERLEELKLLANEAIVLQGDDLKGMTAVVKECDCVILTVAAGRDGNYLKTYLNTAETLIKALKRAPTPQQVIYTSSTSVYGDAQGALVAETHPVAPTHSNSVILCLTEQALLTGSPPEIDMCILRLGEIYGPGRELGSHLNRPQVLPLPGDGSNLTNMVHRDDVVGAILFAIDNNLKGIYNVCNDIHIPRKELYLALSQKNGFPAPQWDPSQPSKHTGNKMVCNQKIQSAGYQIKNHSW